MALTENFDSYSNGSSLNGQGGWFNGPNSFTVTNAQSQSGANSVTVSVAGDNEYIIFPDQISGGQQFYMYFTNTSARCATNMLDSDQNSIAEIQVISGVIRFGNSTFVNLISPTANTWYRLEMQWDILLGVRARVNGGTWTAYNTEQSFTAVSGVGIRALNGSIFGNTYWDSFSSRVGPAGYVLTISQMSFNLSFQAVLFRVNRLLSISTEFLSLTFKNVNLRYSGWKNVAKSIASTFVDKTKSSTSTMSNTIKHVSSWINKPKY